jgi:hypothetical protein
MNTDAALIGAFDADAHRAQRRQGREAILAGQEIAHISHTCGTTA